MCRPTGQPGKRVQHWGAENDKPPRPEEFTYGVTGEKSHGVGDYTESSAVQAYLTMRSEAVYDSSKKEPLGKGFTRNYKLPDQIAKDPNFRFGLAGLTPPLSPQP